MSYTGAVNGPPVNVVGIHRNNDVSHYLVDGQLEFIKIAVQLIDVGVVIVGRICEQLRAPPDRSLLRTVENSHCLATTSPYMQQVTMT